MTIPTTTAHNSYTGSGITGPYPVTFRFFEDSELRVIVANAGGIETEKALTSDYTVTGAGEQSGGSITFISAIPTGFRIVIEPRSTLTQTTDIKNEGGNLREVIEDRFDRLCRDDQVLHNSINRSVRLKVTTPDNVSGELPSPEAGRALRWNDSGTAIVNGSGPTDSANDISILSTGSTTARWASDRFADAQSVKDFGALGDGTTDDTNAIQSALDSGAPILSGFGDEFIVTTLTIPSGVTLRDIRLKEKASVAVVSMLPVINISATNVTCINVVINGNRQNLQSITFANGEDGGMHGFKLSGGASNVRIVDCQANYCGTAGLCVHEAAGPAALYPIHDIYISNFTGQYNREHGMFFDSCARVYINGADLSYNGLTLAAAAESHGNTGASIGGVLFGASCDIETYVNNPLSYIKDLHMRNVVAIGCAKPFIIYSPNAVDAVAEIPIHNVTLDSCRLGLGTTGDLYALSATANSPVAGKYGIDGLVISGQLDGHIITNNVARITCSDALIRTNASVAYDALLNNTEGSRFDANGSKNIIRCETFGAITITKNTGAGTLAGSLSTDVVTCGTFLAKISGSITGGAISGGAMTFTITLPAGLSALAGFINAYNATSGLSVNANVQVIGDSSLRVYVTPTDDTITVDLRIFIRTR